jgi:3-keto-L-gulonate-6-phosphate decarboxylase
MGEFCEEYPKMYTKSTMVIVENINTNLSGGVSSLNILDLKSSGFMVVVVGQLIGEL